MPHEENLGVGTRSSGKKTSDIILGIQGGSEFVDRSY